ncbi:unnamed protein product [Closterium sp. NIES-54]
MAGQDRPVALANANAMLRRVDLCCEVAAPLIFGWLIVAFGPLICARACVALVALSLPALLALTTLTNRLSRGALSRPRPIDKSPRSPQPSEESHLPLAQLPIKDSEESQSAPEKATRRFEKIYESRTAKKMGFVLKDSVPNTQEWMQQAPSSSSSLLQGSCAACSFSSPPPSPLLPLPTSSLFSNASAAEPLVSLCCFHRSCLHPPPVPHATAGMVGVEHHRHMLPRACSTGHDCGATAAAAAATATATATATAPAAGPAVAGAAASVGKALDKALGGLGRVTEAAGKALGKAATGVGKVAEAAGKGWRCYVQQAVMPASAAYVLLFFNAVLSPGGLLTSFLSQHGVQMSVIGAFRGACAAMGFAATFVSPPLVARLGVLQAGSAALVFQALLLALAVAIFSSLSRFPPVLQQGLLLLFLLLVVLSRVGHWTFEIVDSQIIQTAIPPASANLIGTTEIALASLAELLMLGLAIVVHDPKHFAALAAMSMAAVFAAAGVYCSWLARPDPRIEKLFPNQPEVRWGEVFGRRGSGAGRK